MSKLSTGEVREILGEKLSYLSDEKIEKIDKINNEMCRFWEIMLEE